MSIVEGQKVEVSWTNNNRVHFESKNYLFTRHRDKIKVDVEDLMLNSQIKVKATCDGADCTNEFERVYSSLSQTKNHFCSIRCAAINRDKVNSANKSDTDECINAILLLATNLGRSPTVQEYDNYAREQNLTRRRNLEKRLGKKWTEICKEYAGVANQFSKSKEEIYDELLKIKNELGRTPKAKELKDFNFNFKQCYRAYGMKYNDVIKSFGWELSGHESVWKTDEELVEDYFSLYNKLKRVPFWEDIDNDPKMTSSQTYKHRIGSLYEVCKLANIDIDDKLEELNVSYGFTAIDNDGDLCLSYPELLISNLLIGNNMRFIKEYSYRNVISDADSRRRFDWYLPEYNVFIEYFGLYKKSEIGKNTVQGKYSSKVEHKLRQCRENKICLVSLFKKDIENQLQGVISKLSKVGIEITIN
jgi:hypothetical protein